MLSFFHNLSHNIFIFPAINFSYVDFLSLASEEVVKLLPHEDSDLFQVNAGLGMKYSAEFVGTDDLCYRLSAGIVCISP